MRIYGFAAGEFQFMDSSVIGHWSDRDDFPVTSRDYAHEVFNYDAGLEETPANIMDELNDYFGEGQWHVEKGNGLPDGGYGYNYVVADDTVSSWPFIVRRRIVLMSKYYDLDKGWTEAPYVAPNPPFKPVKYSCFGLEGNAYHFPPCSQAAGVSGPCCSIDDDGTDANNQ